MSQERTFEEQADHIRSEHEATIYLKLETPIWWAKTFWAHLEQFRFHIFQEHPPPYSTTHKMAPVLTGKKTNLRLVKVNQNSTADQPLHLAYDTSTIVICDQILRNIRRGNTKKLSGKSLQKRTIKLLAWAHATSIWSMGTSSVMKYLLCILLSELDFSYSPHLLRSKREMC